MEEKESKSFKVTTNVNPVKRYVHIVSLLFIHIYKQETNFVQTQTFKTTLHVHNSTGNLILLREKPSFLCDLHLNLGQTG